MAKQPEDPEKEFERLSKDQLRRLRQVVRMLKAGKVLENADAFLLTLNQHLSALPQRERRRLIAKLVSVASTSLVESGASEEFVRAFCRHAVDGWVESLRHPETIDFKLLDELLVAQADWRRLQAQANRTRMMRSGVMQLVVGGGAVVFDAVKVVAMPTNVATLSIAAGTHAIRQGLTSLTKGK